MVHKYEHFTMAKNRIENTTKETAAKKEYLLTSALIFWKSMLVHTFSNYL